MVWRVRAGLEGQGRSGGSGPVWRVSGPVGGSVGRFGGSGAGLEGQGPVWRVRGRFGGSQWMVSGWFAWVQYVGSHVGCVE